jgi:hypothetical protein
MVLETTSCKDNASKKHHIEAKLHIEVKTKFYNEIKQMFSIK